MIGWSIGKAAELEITLKEKEKTYAVLEDSFKKETLLRKKYKNELEDLKGIDRQHTQFLYIFLKYSICYLPFFIIFK